jgi:hypothetical protein
MDRHFTSPWMLGMYKIVLVQPQPRMQLPDHIPVTPEFRAWHNEWCKEFFGVVWNIPPGKSIKDEENRVLYIRADEWPGLKTAYGKS